MAQNLPLVIELIEQNEALGPIFNLTNALQSALDKVHYRNLLVSKAKYNEAGHYSLSLVTFDNIGLSIPVGGGINLVLNPTTIGPTGSEVDVTLLYKWDILKYVHSFNGANFTQTIEQIFEILLDVAEISKRDFLNAFLLEFFDYSDNLLDFAMDFNSNNPGGLNLSVNSGYTDVLGELDNIINQFDSANVNIFVAIFSDYIQGASFDDSLANLNRIFRSFLGEITLDKILKFVLPKIRISVDDLSIALQFPRNWLIPMIEFPLGSGILVEDPDPSNLSSLVFDVGSLHYSTDTGFDFNASSTFSFQKSIIANTGFTLEFDDARIDLWADRNIIEADIDNRPSTFKGIYIGTASIGLPKSLTPETTTNAQIIGTNLLIGTEGGFSGELSLDGGNLRAEIAGLVLEFVDFDIEFHQNSVINSSIKADLYIPGVKATEDGINALNQPYTTGSPGPISLNLTYSNDVSFPLPNYDVELINNPLLSIKGIEILVHHLKFDFDSDGVNDFNFISEIFIPKLKAKTAGTNSYNLVDYSSYGVGDVIPILLATQYSDSTNTFSLAATNIPAISLLGFELDITSCGFDIVNGVLSELAVTATLLIPGVKDSATGNPAPIGIDFIYAEPDYTITATTIPPIKLFGNELTIHTLTIGFNKTDPPSFEFIGELFIPNLKVHGDSPVVSNPVNPSFTQGSTAPIYFEVSYDQLIGGSEVFTFNASHIPTFNLFGLKVTIDTLGFQIIDGDLSGFSFDAEIDIEGFSGGPIQVVFAYDGITEIYTVGLTSNITLQFGSFSFTFDSFDITFDSSGVISTGIWGTLQLTNNTITFELEFTANGWEIFASDPGGVGFELPNVVDVRIFALRLGKRYGNFFLEIGNETTAATADTIGAALENLLNIPFVGKYLPSELKIGFLSIEEGSGMDLTNAKFKLLWPELEGFTVFSTGIGLEAVIPVNKTIFKTITINTLTVSMSNQDVNGNPGNETVLKALMDGTIEIGPILGTVSEIGLEATISYPSGGGGNIGFGNIDDFSITGPDGIGLSIDTAGDKGGGYLSFNKDKGEYTGYIGLTIQDKISLNAIAILNTKFPDGSSGVSLLIILTAEFNPGIQLGFGFNLSGLGGLFGLHRTMEIEPLRLGVKNGTIDHILFPDPTTFVQNAATHISNIQTIFPVDHGRFVFGPMAKIGWGTPTLITADVGLLLEVPKPIRLAILGVIKAVLPDEDNDLIRLQINFLGLIDFGKKFISFDATIFDSKILTFAISGDMAFRLHYGDNPAFLLSVGGFHPKFNSPIPVPSMNRLMVKIVDEQKFKVSLSTYFAVTSNTVQFGAKIDLYAQIGAISAKGYFGLDTLFQFSPFYMIASISAGVAISYNDFDLAAIHLSGEIEGPTPWKVNGTATFTIIGIEKSFNMSKTFGEERTITYESVDVKSLVVEAIDNDTNWQVTTGRLQDGNVVLKAQSTATNIISANGTLSITQRVVPLNYTIQKYGNRVPSGPRTFTIASVAFGPLADQLADLENIKEDFASAEYKSIDKSTKLSIPSFEKMDGGVKVNPPAGGLDFGGDSLSTTASQRDAIYEKTLIDFYYPDPAVLSIKEVKYDRSNYQLQENWLQREVRGGAAAKSSASKTRTKLYGKTDMRVTIEDETFAVVSTDDLTTTHTAKTRLEAEELMELAINADPTLEGQLQIITNHRSL